MLRTFSPVRRLTLAAGLAAMALAAPNVSSAQAAVGQNAPDFSVTDTQGRKVALSDFKGKHVVLEWVNPGCPFVVKHYSSGNMQATQKGAVDRGVVWLTVNSTAKGHGDYRSPADMAAWMQSQKAVATATLMDTDGRMGRAYGARTTPHMYLIDPAGKLVYAGAIDSKPTANPADIASAVNHVNVALSEVLAGKPVSMPQTRAYGCTIKYADPA